MLKIKEIIVKYKFEIVLAAVLACLYFLIRIYNIMSLPIFTDEAIYVRWSQIARQDASWRFISLTDGKQPMFVWLAMNFLRVIDDPLFASRLVSVFAGFFTMIGLFFLSRELFKNRFIGLLSAFLYVIFPFALVYDRMALYDSLVGTFSVWSLYFEILLVRKIRLDISFILGIILGGGILTKTSGFLSIYLMPLTLLIFKWKQEDKLSKFFKLVGLFVVSGVLAYGYYSVLRLSPFFYIISEKNALFVYTLNEWLSHPFEFIYSNFSGLWNWFITYITWPVFLLIVLSFFISLKFFKEKIILALWFSLPFVALTLFGKTLYPRFIFFMTLPLLPLVAFSVYEIYTKIKTKSVSIIIILAFLILFFRADYFILYDFKNAPIADPDLSQYINDWPSGGGINQIISYLDEKAKNEKIYVLSPGTFGSLPTFSMDIYLGDNKKIEKRGVYPVPDQMPEDLINIARKIPVYIFVSNQKEFEDKIKTWPVVLIVEIPKGKGKAYTRLYKVRTP